MKHVLLKGCLLLLAAALLLSCQKNEPVADEQASTNGLAAKVTAYLQGQGTASQARNQKLDALQKALLLSKLRVEKRSEEEQLVIVPLAKDFTVRENRDRHPLMHLVLSLQNGAIIKGNIVQYMPVGGGQATALPANTLSKLYRYENLACDGMFAVLGLVGEYKFDLTFEDGRLSKQRKAKDSNPNAPATQQRGTTETCTHWWLVTYTFWSDGSTTTDYEYLGEICGECGVPGPSGEATLCDELEGGGGGGDVEYIERGVSEKNWFPYVSPDGYNKVMSTEILEGTLAPDNGNKFTAIRHKDDGAINQFGRDHEKYARWYRYDYEVGGWSRALSQDKKTGTTTIKGILKWQNVSNHPDKTIDETHTWNAANDLY